MRQRMIYRVPKTKDELLALLTRPRVHCVDRALIFNSASDLGALKEFQQMCPSEFPERLPSRSITRDCKTVIYVNRGDLVPLNAGLFQIEGHDSNRSEGWVPLIYEWRSSYPAWRLDANLLTRSVELSTLKTIIEAVLHPAKVTVGPSYNSREAERLRFTIEGGDFNKFQLSQLVGREAAKRGYRRRGKAQIKTDRVHVHANYQIEADVMEGYMNWLKHTLEDDIKRLKTLRNVLKEMIGRPIVSPYYIKQVRDEIRTIALRMKKQGR